MLTERHPAAMSLGDLVAGGFRGSLSRPHHLWESSMKTHVFTPSHETGILVAHILLYAGSDDTRLCAKARSQRRYPGAIFFRPLMVKGVFVL